MESDLPTDEALDRLEERHRAEVLAEAGRHMRHAPRPLRPLRPSVLPETDRLRARLAADAVFVDPLRSSGPWLGTPDDEPLSVVDAGAPFGGHAPLLLVRGYMEGDFGATLLGGGQDRATDALRRTLRALAPSLGHLDLAPCAADARARLLHRLRQRAPERPLFVVGELDGLHDTPHRALPAPPPRLDAPPRASGDLDTLDEAALAALEHALDEGPALAVWLVAIDPAGRALPYPFIRRAHALASARRVPVVIDESAFAPHAAGFVLAGGAELEVDARVLGGPSLPGIVLAQTPIALESEVVEPAAIVRARLLIEGHDPALASTAREQLESRLEALVGRFPDLVLAPRAEGFVFAFDLPTAGHRDGLARQLPLRGALVGHAPAGHPRSVVGRLGHAWTTAEIDRLFDAFRGALKHLEAFFDAHGEGPTLTADELPHPVGRPRSDDPTRETRVRVVSPEEADELLDELVALEERVYEPARRDPREKLALAFHDPAGVAVVAELRDGPEQPWRVVGGALAAPLERIHGVSGCDDDPLRADAISLYSIGTTLDPACRGLGLGERMKAAVVEGAAALRRRDGSPRFHWICGRMRVGATDAMARINRRLGASEVRRLRGQYEGGAEATYYRLPVRGFVAPDVRPAEPVVLHRPERWLAEAPTSFAAAVKVGLAFGAALHGLTPGDERASAASLRAIEILRALHPSWPHVALAASRRAALHLAAEHFGADGCAALVGDDVADLTVRRVPHPADDLAAALASLTPRTLLFVERVQARSGRVVPASFFEALARREIRWIAIERATSGGRHPELSPVGPTAIVWGEGPLGVVHARAPLPLGAAGDELTLVRTTYAALAARALRLSGTVDEAALEQALSPLAKIAIVRGAGLYRVAEHSAAASIAASLRGRGFEARARGPFLAFAPALDLEEERYGELRAALKEATR